MTNLLTAALAWHDAGACVLPAAVDGSKRPAVEWKAYQTQRPTREQVEAWFTSGRYDGLGVLCGAASGNLELVELEGRAVAEGAVAEVAEVIAAAGLGDLWERVTTGGYAEHTPSGGLHLIYRVADEPVPGSVKLAQRPARDDELTADEREILGRHPGKVFRRVLAETRGEGGWVVIAPSAGTTHPTGKPWTVLFGGPDTVPTITAAQRHQLHQVVRTLDQMPAPEAPSAPPTLRIVRPEGEVTPGDDFEAREDWAGDLLLGGAGWKCLTGHPGGYRTWRRPGKDTPGLSATTGRAADRDRLFVMSSATEFPEQVPLTKFGVYAILHHNGDHSAAAKELRRLGYGAPAPLSPDPAAAQREALAELLPSSTPPPLPRRQVLEAVDGTAVRVLAEPTPEPSAFGPTEDGLARALVAAHGHQLRFCPQRGRWLGWDGYRWAWDDAEHHRELIRILARRLPDGDGWATFKKRALSATGVSGVERLARSDKDVVVNVAALDANPYELNTPAGVIDLRTGELRAPDPAALHTRSTTVAPDFDRGSDIFQRFLADTFGADGELSGYVQRLLGVSAIGTVLEQLLPFAHGKGANGKSTLLEAAMHVLGLGEQGYAMAAPAEMLMVRRHAEHPTELAQLAGARLVVCSELEDGQQFAEARIKQLTGRDSINARFMRRDPFTFVPSHTLWLLGNHKPAAKTGGPAFWRRVRLLPFVHVVPAHQRDPRLGEKLAAEGAAILAWLARGAADYHQGGLREPGAVRVATDAYERDQDTVTQFLDETCHLAPGQVLVRVWRDDLRTAYESWCRQASIEPVDARRFVAEIRDLEGVDADGKTRGRRFFTGICLLAEDNDEVTTTGGTS